MAITSDVSAIRLGGTATFSAKLGDSSATGGTWSLDGGSAFGSITAAGVYTSPNALPASASATIRYTLKDHIASASEMLLNPVPELASVTPDTITSTKATVTLTVKNGLVKNTSLTVNGVGSTYTVVDANHLSAVVNVPLASNSNLSFQISNPAPGASTSDVLYASVKTGSPTVLPTEVGPGKSTFVITMPAGFAYSTSASHLPTVTLAGVPLTVASVKANTVTATGYVPAWRTGSMPLSISADDGSASCSCMSVAMKQTAVPYDTASRFATQAAWGPREDVIEHIQALGLSAWIDEQMALAPDQYDTTDNAEQPRTHFLRNAIGGPSQLRERVAYGIQTFVPAAGATNYMTLLPWEIKLESHAFGSYRQILLDAASTYGPASMLNLPANNVRYGHPADVPNQNFARELMQLFSLGDVLLNEDGSLKLDAKGEQQFTYDAATISGVARALSGWQGVFPGNRLYAYGAGADWSGDLFPLWQFHDTGEKVIFGNVVLPAGQTAEQDRTQVLNTIFNHPNLPPFVSRLLIQRLVKSQPTSGYIWRVSQVFKDDGHGVRGNLGAIVKAILLDPEARAGDTAEAGSQDGVVQTPLYSQIAMMNLLNLGGFDDSPVYYPGLFGEDWWYNYSVFGFFSPSYRIPGTSVVSPEFQLLDTNRILARSQFIYGVVTGQQQHFPHGNYTLYTNFRTPEAIVDAMNHMLYHGRMPADIQQAILAYSKSQPTLLLQQQMAIAAALIDDNYLALH